MSSTRKPLRTAAAALVGLGLVAASATAASAHVRVIPETTAAGAWTVLTFRVPNEADAADTTKVVIDLPTDTPFSHVGVRPVPGWKADVQTGTLPEPVDVNGTTLTKAPLHVVFTATGDGLPPGQFEEFELQVGALPAAGTDLVMPAHQTYSDGTVVDWDEPTTGAEEPENPAPELVVTAADDADDAASTPSAAPSSPTAGPSTSAPTASVGAPASAAASVSSDDDGSDALARWLGGLGLLAGVAALVVVVVTSRRGRSDA